ncbi:hypothetical protein FB451DRAFT_1411978 [Mycena latifolia]|nr:hypothetical protein FB451DRAFT_1411978 [Mycena latifolia]
MLCAPVQLRAAGSKQRRDQRPGGPAAQRLKLDVSYTIASNWIKILPNDDGDPHASFCALASLALPETRAQSLQTPALSPIYQRAIPPDEHMLCFDYLYYVGANKVGPPPTILHDSEGYVRLALGIKQVHHSTPPYIAVHVRHGDFVGWCTVPVKDCFAPLSAIARRVAEVKAELLERRGIAVTHVIMTSDQTDSAWWDAVHSRTVAQHGVRYPTLMDAAIQSGTVGFVGTDRSTVSVIARKRVSSWQGGVVRTIKWGTPGADDHQVKISNAGLEREAELDL